MVVLTAKVSKGKIITILLIVVVIVGLLIALCSGSKKGTETAETAATTVQSNEDRVAYLKTFGWEVSPDPVETQEVKIPAELPDVLQKYNELQKSQGFDLGEYGGKTVKRYVYEVTNYPDTTDSYFATLLVYKDAVIGGDVSSAAQNGLMQGLQYPKTT